MMKGKTHFLPVEETLCERADKHALDQSIVRSKLLTNLSYFESCKMVLGLSSARSVDTDMYHPLNVCDVGCTANFMFN